MLDSPITLHLVHYLFASGQLRVQQAHGAGRPVQQADAVGIVAVQLVHGPAGRMRAKAKTAQLHRLEGRQRVHIGQTGGGRFAQHVGGPSAEEGAGGLE